MNPFNQNQDRVLSRAFDRVDKSMDILAKNIRELVFTTNVHRIITAFIIAIMIFKDSGYDLFTKRMLWFLLFVDFCFITIFRKGGIRND